MNWFIICLFFISCSHVQKKIEPVEEINTEKTSKEDQQEYPFLQNVRKFEDSLGNLFINLSKKIEERYIENPKPKSFSGIIVRILPNAVGTTIIRNSSYGIDEDKIYDQYLKGSTDKNPSRFSIFRSLSIFRLQPPLGKDKWHIRFSPSLKFFDAQFSEDIYFRFFHIAMMVKVQYDLPNYGSIAGGLGGGPMWFDGQYEGARETKVKPFVNMFRADFYHYFTEHLVLGISHTHHVFLGDNFKTKSVEIENFFETGFFMAFAINLLSP
ncbi:MAG: hypothetical protein H6622_16340 [Halobacteriovoraceae bacterium]|nr:hypothetical protein [Halobacteriovoraceae bacterium]